MKLAALVSALAFCACFSKPTATTRDGGADDGGDDAMIDGSVVAATVPKLAVGAHHACSIDGADKLWCWGLGAQGQLGGPSSGPGRAVEVPSSNEKWTTVVAGHSHSCGMHGGNVYCWGENAQGQAGGTSATNLISIPGAPTIRTIHAGHSASCAIDTMNRLWCWGLYDPNASAAMVPTQVSPGGTATGWVDLALSRTHACARNMTGKLHCWGDSNHGQLGQSGTTASPDVAVAAAFPLDPTRTFTRHTTGENVTCGVTSESKLECVGYNGSGLLGNALDSNPYGTAALVALGGATQWLDVSLGNDHGCGLSTSGVFCWGFNTDGALGDGYASHLAPAVISFGTTLGSPTEVRAGESVSCARDATGKTACWGANRNGELGNHEVASTRVPVKVFEVSGSDLVVEIAAGQGHTCAVIDNGSGATTLRCWGDNRRKQISSAGTPPLFYESATNVSTGVSSIAMGEEHTCALIAGGLRCWGANGSGQLSTSGPDGTYDALGSFRYVAAGSASTCASATNGDLHCWGTVGTGSNPVNQLSAAWNHVAVGSFGMFGILVDSGTNVEMGGVGSACAFGSTGSNSTFAAPHQFGNVSTATESTIMLAAAQTNGQHVCTWRYGGGPTAPASLVCYGSNSSHQLDDQLTTGCHFAAVPPLPSSKSWVPFNIAERAVSIANAHSCAIADEDMGSGVTPRLYCWGANNYGELGNVGSGAANGIPSVVNSLPVAEVATAARHTCVITENHREVHCWGDNRYGEVGNGYRFHERPVAVLIP